MTTQLLIIKDRQGYIRFTNDSYEHCDLNKASVFPLHQVDDVKRHLDELSNSGSKDPKIYLLTINEDEFTD